MNAKHGVTDPRGPRATNADNCAGVVHDSLESAKSRDYKPAWRRSRYNDNLRRAMLRKFPEGPENEMAFSRMSVPGVGNAGS